MPKTRIPPHSEETEASLLGALLIDKDAVTAVASMLLPEHFYTRNHQLIFEAILGLYEERQPVDVVTVAEALKKKRALSRVGGRSFLASLVNRVPTSAHVDSYAKIIKDLYTKRTLISISSGIVDESFDEGKETSQVLEKAEQAIFSLSQKHLTRNFIPIKEALAESFDRLDELHKKAGGLRGVPTGFRDLDDTLAGMQDSNLLILAGRPGLGKCIVEDSEIIDPETGKVLTIKDVFKKRKNPVLTLDKDLKVRKAKVSNFLDDKIKPVFKVKTLSGRKIETTAVHPFLTVKGWRRLSELKPGVKIAVPRKLPIFGKNKLPDFKIKLLAYFIADGGLTNLTPRFTNGNPKIVKDFLRAVKEFGDIKTRKIDSQGTRTPSYYISGIKKGEGGPRPKNKATLWLESLGLMGKKAPKKFIPPVVFTLTKENIALFLNRLFACDGSACAFGWRNLTWISYSSSSEKLARQVQHLLLRFGILSKLREKRVKYKGSHRYHYEVMIFNIDNSLKFIKEIGILGKERALLKVKKTVLKRKRGGYTKDTIPIEIWEKVLEEKRGKSWKQIYQMLGLPKSHNIHAFRRNPRRETICKLGKVLNSRELMVIGESDIFWDEITSITFSGKKHVYDLEVQDTHNFIANDVFVHNTAMALNIAHYCSVEEGIPVGFFSLEMSKEELIDRLLVAQADIDAWKLKTGRLDEEDFARLSDAMGVLAEAPLFVDDTPGASISEMRTKARRLQLDEGLKLLVVDYLQLATAGRRWENRVQEVSAISMAMKNLSRELRIPVLALSQLSRAVEHRGTKKPQLADLRESGGLEQDADVVMFLYREEEAEVGNMKLSIDKHRNGPLRMIDLRFRGDRIRFYGMEKRRGE